MLINQVVTSIDISTGGPARSVTHLIRSICTISKEVAIKLDTIISDKPIIKDTGLPNAEIRFNKKATLGKSKELKNNLTLEKVDLFHGQGIWQIPVHQMCKVARNRNIPYIITPRGMLEPWSLKQRALKKKIAMRLYQHNDLIKASCIHATAMLEAQNIRKLGYKNPIAIIPNGIKLEDFPEYEKPKRSEKKLLFLSRIHQKKGIEILFEAWGKLMPQIKKNWKIEIVGNGESSYIDNLNLLIKEKGLEREINITKPVFGNEKIKKYQEADLFVLPTHSENFGIVIAEALACKVPVITTKGTPWEDLELYNSGKWINIGVDPLIEALESMLSKTSDELTLMGENGRKLIEEKYSMNSVAEQMILLYKWIIFKGEKPAFVI